MSVDRPAQQVEKLVCLGVGQPGQAPGIDLDDGGSEVGGQCLPGVGRRDQFAAPVAVVSGDPDQAAPL